MGLTLEGKSTLINALTGTTMSDYQKLRFFDKDFRTHEKAIKEDIAVIYDSCHYDEDMTPAFIGKMLSHIYRHWDGALYESYLQRFELPSKKRLKAFSRGMKMKLEFAIALSHQPKLLILDEATSGLDPIVRDDILEILRDFTEKDDHSVLLSSHITSDLDKIADYIAYIHQGELYFIKSMEELREDYGIVHIRKELLTALSSDDVERVLEEPYSYRVLLKNRQAVQKVYADLEVLRPTVEEIMLLYAKGVTYPCMD